MPSVNWLAVVAAALSMFVIGGVWYGPLFDKAWMAANRFTPDDLRRTSMPVVFGGAFVFALLIAANLAFFVAGVPDLGLVVAYAVAAGLGFAGFALGHIALFERRPPAYFLINIGYLTVAFAVMGLILGLWR